MHVYVYPKHAVLYGGIYMKGFLKVISVIMIILGILIVGLMVFNISIIRTAGDGVIADVLTGAMIVVLGISGVMDLLGGFLGLRAAKDPGKTTAALVFGILAVIPGAISLIMETSTENICGLIIPVLYLVCVIAIRGSREN